MKKILILLVLAIISCSKKTYPPKTEKLNTQANIVGIWYATSFKDYAKNNIWFKEINKRQIEFSADGNYTSNSLPVFTNTGYSIQGKYTTDKDNLVRGEEFEFNMKTKIIDFYQNSKIIKSFKLLKKQTPASKPIK